MAMLFVSSINKNVSFAYQGISWPSCDPILEALGGIRAPREILSNKHVKIAIVNTTLSMVT